MRSRLFRVPARQLHMLPYARPALRLRRARPLPCLPAQPRRTFGPPGRAFAARGFWRDSRLFCAAVRLYTALSDASPRSARASFMVSTTRPSTMRTAWRTVAASAFAFEEP